MAISMGKGSVGVLTGVFIASLAVVVAVLLLRTYNLPELKVAWKGKGAPRIELEEDEREQLYEALKGALRIPTVSFSPSEQNTTALEEFKEYIKSAFPRLFNSSLVEYELVGEYSHLFNVQGSDNSLLPYMLIAHLDVVPATPEGWDLPPFSGEEKEGYIYGRGSLDDKNRVIGILQGLEFLFKRGYKPRRSFYIGLGHDEEIGGRHGAKEIVKTLETRNVKLEFLLDEGFEVLDGVIYGTKRPIALIGVTEKGAITLNLTVNSPPGHSSMPPRESSIGILSAALSRLEQDQMPNRFGKGPEGAMFEQLADEFYFPLNIVMANLWLFGPLVSRILQRTPSGNALVRTTTALTIFNAGIKSNVIPQTARATVNFRIHPAETVNEVLKAMNTTIMDDRVIPSSDVPFFDPPSISPHDEETFGYQTVKRSITDVFLVEPVAPGVSIGNTASIYKFRALVIKDEDLSRFHGINERISKEGIETVVQFYFQLIQNSDTDIVPVQSHLEL
uniref:Peptidase M20 dimerisation domain-containing protein n=1 Tax=Leptobrachium leishanense TaxID=445787 RepID=A0A8C5M0V5_9ANUR